MNWCRQDKRLAVYLRDGLSCCYCGHSLEHGAALTLDHCRPRSKGGDNAASNLVTACERCNKARQDRPLTVWARAVAEYLNNGLTDRDILGHVRRCRQRVLKQYRAEAKRLIARRGSAARVLAAIGERQ